MNKKLVALILSISLFNSFIMDCSNDKKDISNNFNINKMDKKTFDEVIKKFNAEHTLLMLNVIFNYLLKISLNLYKKHM